MLKIRLSRTGKKSQPSFRVVVQEHTSAIKGKFIEELGYYRPTTPEKEFKVNLERIKYWLSVGAQPSDSVAVLLKKNGLDGMDKFIAPRDKQKKKKQSEQGGAPLEPKDEGKAEEQSAPATEDASKEEKKEEAAVEPTEEAPKEETPPEEAPPKEEAPVEEKPADRPEAEAEQIDSEADGPSEPKDESKAKEQSAPATDDAGDEPKKEEAANQESEPQQEPKQNA